MIDAPDLGADGPAALRRHRFDAVIPGTRRVVATAVASEPLDAYAAAGQLTDDAYEAGKTLRGYIAGASLMASRCTAPARYASAASEYDDEDPMTDDERAEAQRAAYARVREACHEVGPRDWPTVKAVCEGYWIARLSDIGQLRRGLDALARKWGTQ